MILADYKSNFGIYFTGSLNVNRKALQFSIAINRLTKCLNRLPYAIVLKINKFFLHQRKKKHLLLAFLE